MPKRDCPMEARLLMINTRRKREDLLNDADTLFRSAASKSTLFNIGFVIWVWVKSAANYGDISTVLEP
jgi:hypothetical protein